MTKARDLANFVSTELNELEDFASTFTLPISDGTDGQFLQTDGSGNLTFGSPVPGVTTGKAIAMAMIFGF